MPNNPSYVAQGTINSSRFVKLDGTNEYGVVQCGAGDMPVGVSHEGSREAPLPGVTPVAANSGESFRVYGLGETCEVTAGGTVTTGDKVKADADAKAVTASAGDKYGGTALGSATVGQLLRIQVQPGELET